MKFETRKDLLFSAIILGICLLLTCFTILDLVSGKMYANGYWPLLLVSGVVGLLLWLFYGTYYEVSEKDGFLYRSGPLSGKIQVERITEIIKGKTLWVGFRPATARNGLIIKYDKHNEIYISPKTNDTFISAILKLNSGIKITDGQVV